MQYRHLGRSGLRVSALSLGSWVTYHNQVDTGQAREMMAAAFDAGVNLVVIRDPGAERQGADAQAGAAEVAVLHGAESGDERRWFLVGPA